jgi:molecular chaperone HscC
MPLPTGCADGGVLGESGLAAVPCERHEGAAKQRILRQAGLPCSRAFQAAMADRLSCRVIDQETGHMLVGIDLGTTHSLVSVWTDDGPRLIPNALGSVLTPSVVALDDAGHVLVGAAAQERLRTHPRHAVATFKRYMGTDRASMLGERSFRPEELSALVLKSLLADVEAETGERATEAVISVPAYFSDAQRKATRNAGTLAGITVERLVNEPTAAALAYGLEQRDAESRFLVIDLGGGTFDVSILELFDQVMEVHATAGDNFLGGEDFVELLLNNCLADLGIGKTTLGLGDTVELQARMERLKRQLSQGEASTELTLNGKHHTWQIDEARFEHLAAPLLARMRAPIERALRDSRLAAADLNEIILVGGASRMPMVSRLVTRMFGRLPLRHINPDEAIARGAAVMAGLKGRAAALGEVVMTDVCPYTLGIETSQKLPSGHLQQGVYSPIIERNTVVPTSRSSVYTPLGDFQTALKLRVYQGESVQVASNVFLGELEIELPRAKAAEMPVEVRFTYDVNGLIEVEATVLANKTRHQLTIQQNPGLLTPEQVAERLAALQHLKVHPRDDQANVAIIARAERLYEERSGDLRQQIAQWLLGFRGELESQEPSRIRTAQKRMQELLAQVEAESPF